MREGSEVKNGEQEKIGSPIDQSIGIAVCW